MSRRVQAPPEQRIFEVTVPFIRPARSLHAFSGRLEGEHLVAEGSVGEHALTGQEFTRFRGVSTPEHVASLGKEYGLIGLYSLARAFGSGPHPDRPLAWWALTAEPEFPFEPVLDWIRQAGLVDLAYGLLGLVTEPGLTAALKEHASAYHGPALGTHADQALAIQRANAAALPWQLRSIFDGAARAGLECIGLGEEIEVTDPRTGKRRLVRRVQFVGIGWRAFRDGGGFFQMAPLLRIEPSQQGAAEAFRDLVDPWLGRIGHTLQASDGRLRAALRLPGDVIDQLWLQLAAASLADVSPRPCAWEGCPGPPDRPGVFLWRWGATPTGTKHRDSVYCHPLCQHAAAVSRARRARGAKPRPRSAPGPR